MTGLVVERAIAAEGVPNRRWAVAIEPFASPWLCSLHYIRVSDAAAGLDARFDQRCKLPARLIVKRLTVLLEVCQCIGVISLASLLLTTDELRQVGEFLTHTFTP